MIDPTPRQLDALRLIREHIAENGFSPSIRELAVGLGISIHAAECHLRALARKGAIKRTPNIARGITIPQP